MLFDALQGSKALEKGWLVLRTQKLFLKELDNSERTIVAARCEWWQRPKHLGTQLVQSECAHAHVCTTHTVNFGVYHNML